MPELASLRERFLTAAPGRPQDLAALDATLEDVLVEARGQWPSLGLTDEAFIAALAARVQRAPDVTVALGRLHAADLFLTTAVVAGLPGAAEELERAFFPVVDRAVASFDRGPSFADEVRQALRDRLYVRKGVGPPKLASYSGQGPFTVWLRACAVRIAMRLRSGDARVASNDDERLLEELPAAQPDPELAYVKATYRRDLRAAFHDALAALSPRERTLLRLQAIDGLSGAEVAAAFGVSAPTASRWLARARQTLLEETRRLLAQRLSWTPEEIERNWGLVQSQLDVSLSRVLR